MIHLQKITSAELATFVPFPFLVKANRPYAEKDIVILDEYDESSETIKNEDGTETTTVKEIHTGKQTFFTIEKVMSAENTKGIRKGFLMLKLKRIAVASAMASIEETQA